MIESNSESKQYRVVVYMRKSSEDNKRGKAYRQLNSLKYQKRIIDEIVKRERLILLRTEPFQDDHTGYKAYARDGFKALLDYIRNNKGKVDGIVCTEISRLARNFGDGGQILWFLQDGLITRIFTHDKIFTDSSSDQLMVAINFALAKHSSDETSFRAQAAAEAKIETQKQPPKKPILGYLSEGRVGQKKWVLDQENASKIRKLFEEYSAGKHTIESIADYAYLIELRSKDEKSKTGKLSKNTIRNRLMDIQYTGVFVYKGEKHAGDYPPIISSELFYRVQKLFDTRQHPKASHREYAYTGLIKCNNCGRFLSGTHKKGNTYYRCDKRIEPCKRLHKINYINEKILEKDLVANFEAIEINEKRWQMLREYVFEVSEEDKGEYFRKAEELANEIHNEEENQKSYAKALIENKINKEMHEKLMVDSIEKVKVLRESQIKCENYVNELRSLMFSFLDNVKFITKRFKVASPANKKEMVDIFCENLRWDGKKLRWCWTKPYSYLAKPQNNSTWLPG